MNRTPPQNQFRNSNLSDSPIEDYQPRATKAAVEVRRSALVELDAIDPERLRNIVEAAVLQHLPAQQLHVLKVAEASERELLSHLIREYEKERDR